MENVCQILSDKKTSSSSLNKLPIDETNSHERLSVIYHNHLGLFLDHNKLIGNLIVDAGKHENILFLIDFHTAPLSESVNTTQAGNTEKISNVLPKFSSRKSPICLQSNSSFILDQDNLTRWKSNMKKPLIGLTAILISLFAQSYHLPLYLCKSQYCKILLQVFIRSNNFHYVE